MPHIHKYYDFVVSVFIVRQGKVLMVHHKRYDEWLPIGGHVELDEHPEQALLREIREECALRVKIMATKPAISHPGVKPLWTPSYMDVHRIDDEHKHIAFVYFAKALSSRVRLHSREHYCYAWLSKKDLKSKKYRLTRSIQFYCQKALAACA